MLAWRGVAWRRVASRGIALWRTLVAFQRRPLRHTRRLLANHSVLEKRIRYLEVVLALRFANNIFQNIAVQKSSMQGRSWPLSSR